jgi:hypothetical protein
MEVGFIGPIVSAFETIEYHVDSYACDCDRVFITY